MRLDLLAERLDVRGRGVGVVALLVFPDFHDRELVRGGAALKCLVANNAGLLPAGGSQLAQKTSIGVPTCRRNIDVGDRVYGRVTRVLSACLNHRQCEQKYRK